MLHLSRDAPQVLLYIQACSQGGLVSSDKPPSQKRSTIKKVHSFNKKSLFSPACKHKVLYKENKSPLSKKVHQHFI